MEEQSAPNQSGYLRVIGIFGVIVVLMLGGGAFDGQAGQTGGNIAGGKVLAKDVVVPHGGSAQHLLGLHVVARDGTAHNVVVECGPSLWETFSVGDEVQVRYEIEHDTKALQIKTVEPAPPPVEL